MPETPLFPVTVAGSWPRSTEMVRALRRKEAGAITLDELTAVVDGVVVDCTRAQEGAGVDIISQETLSKRTLGRQKARNGEGGGRIPAAAGRTGGGRERGLLGRVCGGLGPCLRRDDGGRRDDAGRGGNDGGEG